MKKTKRTRRRLRLDRETVRGLSGKDLKKTVGGVPPNTGSCEVHGCQDPTGCSDPLR